MLAKVMAENGIGRTGVHGALDLTFRRGRGDARTRLVVQEQLPPLRVVRAFDGDDQMAVVHLHNLSGGVLGGDQMHLTARVEASAQAQITTTGSTRVYRHRAGYVTATQTNHLCVGAGGLLEYLPDSLIPYGDARFRQTTRIELAEDAGLFYWEVVAPGRTAQGEEFAYDLLQLELEIVAEGRLLAIERMRWQPHLHDLRSPARLGGYSYYGVLYACRVGVQEERWLALERELHTQAQALTCPGEALWGVSSLPAYGLSVRVLSRNSRAIASGLFVFWQALKRSLYGQEAIPPRKVY
ncbi:MAG: urease accessory protein UreD [Chloroflexi bacterium]|nr:urease accessory protein UreD [Chloroflexota bacterium]